MKPKFSVIVPVYNVEQYLHYCVNSILKQNYKKFEIILVNDGSQDNCPRICDEYAEQDKRIKVIHKENGGLSDARNAGLSEAAGDYLLFVDSDDLIEQNSLSEIARTIENNNFPDVVFLEATKFYANGRTETMGDGYIHEMIDGKSYSDVLKFIETMPKFPGSACTKAVKKEMIDDRLKFQVGILSEDDEWSIRLFGIARSFAYCDKPYYLYRQQREGSITHSVSEKAIKSLIEIIEKHSFTKVESEYEYFCNVVCSYILMILIYNISEMSNMKDELLKRTKKLLWIFKYASSKKTKITAFFTRMVGIKLTGKLLRSYRRMNR